MYISNATELYIIALLLPEDHAQFLAELTTYHSKFMQNRPLMYVSHLVSKFGCRIDFPDLIVPVNLPR